MAKYTASVTLTCALDAESDREANERLVHLTGLLEGFLLRPELQAPYMSNIEIETTDLVPED